MNPWSWDGMFILRCLTCPSLNVSVKFQFSVAEFYLILKSKTTPIYIFTQILFTQIKHNITQILYIYTNKTNKTAAYLSLAGQTHHTATDTLKDKENLLQYLV